MSLTFTIARYESGGKKAVGVLDWADKGLSVTAVSGPYGEGFLPLGDYTAKRSELLDKSDSAYKDLKGLGWMQVIRPNFATSRTDLGIHPDGNVPGTEGCIGINPTDTKNWFDAFKSAAGLTVSVKNAASLVSEPTPTHRLNVFVSGDGRSEHAEIAEAVGEFISRQGYNLITGGGGGVMTSASRGFAGVKDRTGVSIGILPGFYEDREDSLTHQNGGGYPNNFIDMPISTHLWGSKGDFEAKIGEASRNHLLVLNCDLMCVIGGGEGTESEVHIATRLGKPVIFIDPRSERFDHLLGAPNVYVASSIQDLRDLIR